MSVGRNRQYTPPKHPPFSANRLQNRAARDDTMNQEIDGRSSVAAPVRRTRREQQFFG